jgi:glycine/D-amino acid oxidase-like deaminating enzyme
LTQQPPPADQPADEADVIVVGAGPAGSATAYYLAQAGLDVLVLEKAAFPRDKVCGDGLTPRAVKQLTAMGIRSWPVTPVTVWSGPGAGSTRRWPGPPSGRGCGCWKA